MMELEVRRKKQRETAISVGGELWVDGQFECFTLEPARTTPVHPGHPCIPAGRYKAILTLSPHMGYTTPELLGVPGRDKIRIHVANFPQELLGCTAVGGAWKKDAVLGSKDAFQKLMTLMKTEESGEWTVEYKEEEDAQPGA